MNTNAANAFTGIVSNKTTAIATGDAIANRQRVDARTGNTTLADREIDYGPDGFTFTTGCSVGQSTTDGTATIPGGADFFFEVVYVPTPNP